MDVFNFLKQELLAQGARSAGPDGGCRLRGGNGLKCAVGFLVPDSMYDISMESKLSATVHRFTDDHELVMAIATIHDSCAVETWEVQLEELHEQGS